MRLLLGAFAAMVSLTLVTPFGYTQTLQRKIRDKPTLLVPSFDHVKISSSQQPHVVNEECGESPQCEPTPANDCCAFMEKCNPDIYCPLADFEKQQAINPDLKPVPYCKSCEMTDLKSQCFCSETPSPSGPFAVMPYDQLNFRLANAPKSNANTTSPLFTIKSPTTRALYSVKYTDEAGVNKTLYPKNADQILVYKQGKKYWVGCASGAMHLAPKPGDSFTKIVVSGTHYTVKAESIVVIKSLKSKCGFSDYDSTNQKRIETPIPSTGFEFSRDSDIIAVHIKQTAAAFNR